jgi:hypothetical protein
VINGAGETAFWATLTGDGVTSSNAESIWTEGAGRGLTLIARQEAPAPGMPAGVYFSSFRHRGGTGRPVINDLGQTAFFARVGGPGSSGIFSGIWSEGGGTLHLVARADEPAPGTEAGVTFGNFNGDSLVINSMGSTAFGGNVNGPGVSLSNRFGVWLEEASGELTLVARQGELAPGGGPDLLFGNLEFVNLLLNGAGQIAFQSALTEEGGTAAGIGIFATDIDGVLRLIVREGELFDVSNDPLVQDLRTIKSADLVGTGSGGEDGLASSFNDAGQLAFRLGFTDGSSGVFVATIVPEPSSVVGLWFLCGAMLTWRCRR